MYFSVLEMGFPIIIHVYLNIFYFTICMTNMLILYYTFNVELW